MENIGSRYNYGRVPDLYSRTQNAAHDALTLLDLSHLHAARNPMCHPNGHRAGHVDGYRTSSENHFRPTHDRDRLVGNQ